MFYGDRCHPGLGEGQGMGMSPVGGIEWVTIYGQPQIVSVRTDTSLTHDLAPSQSLDGAERVRLARLARFQRSSTATRMNNSPGSL